MNISIKKAGNGFIVYTNNWDYGDGEEETTTFVFLDLKYALKHIEEKMNESN